MTQPLVSIVTPSFNQGKFIRRTIESVLGQDYPHVDFRVVDGGSTDETLEILRGYGDRFPWVSEKDRGQTHAINKGLAQAKGQIIGWLNSDDLYYPGALAAVVAYFQAHPEVDVVYGEADHVDLEDRAFEPYPTEDWDLDALAQRSFICQPAPFFRRRTVERFGALDDALQYCMDYELWLRWGRAGARFARLPVKLAGSRLYADNKTLGARVKVHAEINDMLKKTLGRVPERWLFNYAYARVDAMQPPPRMRRLSALREAIAASLKWNGQWPRAVFWRSVFEGAAARKR